MSLRRLGQALAAAALCMAFGAAAWAQGRVAASLTAPGGAGSAASNSSAVVTTPQVRAELLAHAKTVKEEMNFASAGIGSVSHLNFEVFMDKTGMKAIHVPYKGGGQVLEEVLQHGVSADRPAPARSRGSRRRNDRNGARDQPPRPGRKPDVDEALHHDLS